MKLEQTCIEKVKSIDILYPTEEELRCRNCNNTDFCERYKPISETGEPFRRGRNAYLLASLK